MDGMANSVDPDQIGWGTLWAAPTLFEQAFCPYVKLVMVMYKFINDHV